MNMKVKVILAVLMAVKALLVHMTANLPRADAGCLTWWHIPKSWGGYVVPPKLRLAVKVILVALQVNMAAKAVRVVLVHTTANVPRDKVMLLNMVQMWT